MKMVYYNRFVIRVWLKRQKIDTAEIKDLPLLGDLSWVMSFLVVENGCSRRVRKTGRITKP